MYKQALILGAVGLGEGVTPTRGNGGVHSPAKGSAWYKIPQEASQETSEEGASPELSLGGQETAKHVLLSRPGHSVPSDPGGARPRMGAAHARKQTPCETGFEAWEPHCTLK